MSGSVNKVILVGNLGRDPESRTFQTGGKMVTLSLATSERWKDRTSGEQRERTEWHRVVIMSEGLVTVAERYLRKGSKVYLEGQLRTRKWQDQAGQDCYATEVVLGGFNASLVLLDKAQGGPGRNDYSGYGDTPGAGGGGDAGSGPEAAADAGARDDLDDDVPF
ncbi:single-strand binding protein [Hephaestia caeni]|uniref:Single-stranded DNA-binding protein n=1 Tax=Hephaestia caeni TaxID=645617 RepID=A0A397NJ10_9SPHN|nr:single-stranded DNA-binding protein [Hephaestia caeni]RIA37490.1 single-strand binding protein [Hephaestia caeni]